MLRGRVRQSALAVMLLAVGGLWFAAPSAESVIAEARMVPIDRLARNLENLIAKDPRNVQLRVNLARAHAMAYALKKSELPVDTSLEHQGAYFGWGKNEAIPFEVKPATSDAAMRAARTQLGVALTKYREALAVGPSDLVANLGYAWCLAQSGDRLAAIAAYRKTIDLAWQVEQKPRNAMMGDPSITEEAAKYLIPLLDKAKDADEIVRLRERISAIDKVTRRWITPIAIPLEPGLTANDVRDEKASVLFDADGSAVAKRWTWITPKAGWLVSDIHHDGRIRSGLQLFGNVTWWLFWNNGYEPLRALDDNGDRTIAGGELAGLAIWRDVNTNGVSDAGEVRPLAAWKIASLSTTFRYDSTDQDEIPFSPQGVTFTDGSARATYDLILRRK